VIEIKLLETSHQRFHFGFICKVVRNSRFYAGVGSIGIGLLKAKD
jgi:hypothetical protein